MWLGTSDLTYDIDDEDDARRCEGSGCYSLNLTYDVPIQQIEALIAMSDTCEQEIKFEVSYKMFLTFFSHDSFPVQVGPFEERGIWGEVWMVDKPTRPKKGKK